VRLPSAIQATADTIYDLASLTKPLVTGLLCAEAVESGALVLEAVASRYLSEFNQSDKSSITVQQLLTHSSGLPAWRPLYLLTESSQDVLTAIANEPLQTKPGERVIYSDLGFIVLGFLLQRLYGAHLDGLAEREIFAPLQLTRSSFRPAEAVRTGIAACENGNRYERNMCERDFPARAYSNWREGTVWGEVHDGRSCRFIFDGPGDSPHRESIYRAAVTIVANGDLRPVSPEPDARFERSTLVRLATRSHQRFDGRIRFAA